MAPLISFTTKVGKLQPPLVLIDQMKSGQVSHVARQQVLRLRNTKGDAPESNFLVRAEWCPKTTFHGLPPKLMFEGKHREVTARSAFGRFAFPLSPVVA